MGSPRRLTVSHPDCANCGERVGVLSSSRWDIGNARVCSDACGERLHAKLKHGMRELIPDIDSWPCRVPPTESHAERRVRRLRTRIKVLENRLRRLADQPEREDEDVSDRSQGGRCE